MKLNRRGKAVRAVAIAGLVYFIYLFATNFWWSENGPCWGSMVKCVGI